MLKGILNIIALAAAVLYHGFSLVCFLCGVAFILYCLIRRCTPYDGLLRIIHWWRDKDD